MSDAAEQAAFIQILEFLRQTRGCDFTSYKPASLMRRVRKRMREVGVEHFEEYLDQLQVRPDEFSALFNRILINVTSFFRDQEVWEGLRASVLPEVIAANGPSAPIRVWSAGCASGQEPYTVAMLLAEQIGLEPLRERVKLYATDIDDEALGEARRGVYSRKQIADVPETLLAKYFDQQGDQYRVNHELRRAVIFGRHDLLQDAPISRVNLLLCRNTLMYFNAEAQARLLSRFGFSLTSGGILTLGRAEMLFNHHGGFQPVDLKRRIFRSGGRSGSRERALLAGQPAGGFHGAQLR
jgi:two-component system CheB/CheR fusion protein